MKRPVRGYARAAEQDFRTCELMLSGSVAKTELTVDRSLSTFSGAKDAEFSSS